MGNTILLISSDEEYVRTIELKLAKVFAGRTHIDVITDYNAISKYFESGKKVDTILIPIEDSRYVKGYASNIRVIYIVEDNNSSDDKNTVFKYASIKMLADIIDSNVSKKRNNGIRQKTEVIGVFSVSGGSGLTLGALSIAHNLFNDGKKVIYINTTLNQDYMYYLDNIKSLSTQFSYQSAVNLTNAIKMIESEIIKQEFYYIPPYANHPIAYQVSFTTYVKIIEYIRQTNTYDYIVAEIDGTISQEKLAFLKTVDKIVVTTRQDEASISKLEKVLAMVPDIKERVLIVCNMFLQKKRDYLKSASLSVECIVSEYVYLYDIQFGFEEAKNKKFLEKTTRMIGGS